MKRPEAQVEATSVDEMIDLLLAPCVGCGWRGVAIVTENRSVDHKGAAVPAYAALRCQSCLREHPLYLQFDRRAKATLNGGDEGQPNEDDRDV